MVIDEFASNESVEAELGNRIRRARLAFPLTQEQLAQRAGLSLRTIANLERGAGATLSTVASALRALGMLSRLDLLVPEQEERPSDLLAAKPERKRFRPSAKRDAEPAWKWGDER